MTKLERENRIKKLDENLDKSYKRYLNAEITFEYYLSLQEQVEARKKELKTQ